LVRDGRDVVVSWIYHLMRICAKDGYCVIYDWYGDTPHMRSKVEKYKNDNNYFSDHPEELVQEADEKWFRGMCGNWAWFQKDSQEAMEEMAQGSTYTLFYEKLHSETDEERQRLYKFLGLDVERRRPLTPKTLPGFGRNTQESQHGESFFRKGEPGDWKRYATPLFKKWFKEVAGNSLIFYGYEKDKEW